MGVVVGGEKEEKKKKGREVEERRGEEEYGCCGVLKVAVYAKVALLLHLYHALTRQINRD